MELSSLPRWKQAVAAHPALVDAVWATAFVIIAFTSTKPGPGEVGTNPTSDPRGILLLLLISLPYYWRRKAPLAVFAVSSGAVVLLAGLDYFEGGTPVLILFGAYTVGARCSSRVVAGAYAVLFLALLGLYVSDAPGFDVTTLFANAGLFAAAFLFGGNLQSRSARLDALEQQAIAVTREHEEEARRALADERLRIAQELHDVVAHSMGVIAVQAGAGMHVIDADPAEAKRSLEAISSTSRSTLTEIRRLLGVLRDEQGQTAAFAPAPGLDDLPLLARELTDAGVTTELRLDGDRHDVPKGVELTTYRIVQEALTNVLKHGGPGATATVVVTFEPGTVQIDAADDGRGIDLASDGAEGHGLLGMRERVGVYGGELQAGPRPSGGFRVTALLPYGAQEHPSAADTAGAAATESA